MAAYVIAQLTVDDPKRYWSEYAKSFLPLLQQAGGELLMVDDEPELVEGQGPGGRLVIFRFPDKAAFRQFYNSPEYQAILPHRLANARTHIVAVGETSAETAAFLGSHLTAPAVAVASTCYVEGQVQ